jgi:phosphoglycolate phosphatase
MRAVCLFDIDGTLLSTGGAGQHAMERALEAVCGIAQIRGEVLAAGRTDRAILSDLFLLHEIENTPELWSRFQRTYLELLPRSLAELKGRVLPGVAALLEELSSREDVALGLLTGNFRDGAALKLRHYRIDHHFRFGGYGDDHHERDDVARVAFREAVRHLRREVAADTVWVLGDTPSDVRCARAIGAKAVAVATGIFSYEDLERTEPDEIHRDFSDPEPLLRRIVG